jgi:hypothetical protein
MPCSLLSLSLFAGLLTDAQLTKATEATEMVEVTEMAVILAASAPQVATVTVVRCAWEHSLFSWQWAKYLLWLAWA